MIDRLKAQTISTQYCESCAPGEMEDRCSLMEESTWRSAQVLQCCGDGRGWGTSGSLTYSAPRGINNQGGLRMNVSTSI